jgi:hypothetical protein
MDASLAEVAIYIYSFYFSMATRLGRQRPGEKKIDRQWAATGQHLDMANDSWSQ